MSQMQLVGLVWWQELLKAFFPPWKYSYKAKSSAEEGEWKEDTGSFRKDEMKWNSYLLKWGNEWTGRFSRVVGLNSIHSLLRVSDFEFNVSPTLGSEWVCVCICMCVCVCVCVCVFPEIFSCQDKYEMGKELNFTMVRARTRKKIKGTRELKVCTS